MAHLREEEFETVSDLRCLNDSDWANLKLPLFVKTRLRNTVQAGLCKADTVDGQAAHNAASASGGLSVGASAPTALTQLDVVVMDVSYSMKSRSSLDQDKTREDVSKVLVSSIKL